MPHNDSEMEFPTVTEPWDAGEEAVVVPFRRPRRPKTAGEPKPAAARAVSLSSVLMQAVRAAARPGRASREETIREDTLLEVLQVMRKARE